MGKFAFVKIESLGEAGSSLTNVFNDSSKLSSCYSFSQCVTVNLSHFFFMYSLLTRSSRSGSSGQGEDVSHTWCSSWGTNVLRVFCGTRPEGEDSPEAEARRAEVLQAAGYYVWKTRAELMEENKEGKHVQWSPSDVIDKFNAVYGPDYVPPGALIREEAVATSPDVALVDDVATERKDDADDVVAP